MAKARAKAQNSHLEGKRSGELRDGEVVEGPRPARSRGVAPQPEDGEEHEDAADEGEEEELHRRVDAALAPPESDEEVHRDEHRLPEDVEEDEVERGERPDHRRLQDEERDAVLLDPILDVVPRAEHDDGPEEGGEQDEEERHPVETDVVAEPERRRPVYLLLELPAARLRPEADPQRQREEEGDDRRQERDAFVHPALASRQEEDDDRAGERQEDDQGEERTAFEAHGQVLTRNR